MKKVLKTTGRWLCYALLTLLLAASAGFGYAWWNVQGRLNKVYPTHTPAIAISDDSSSRARGAHLYVVHGCRDCHGADSKGRVVLDHPLLGRLVARNLTKGAGGLPGDFNDEDWLRTLKHGVNRQGKPLLIMPANETTKISDEDLADIIAFCKSRPPVDNVLPGQHLGPVLLATIGLAEPAFFPAEKFDHSVRPIAHRQPEATAGYGAYLTTNCTACHQENFRGSPPLAPGYPAVPDITSEGRVGKWTEEQFMRTLRTGVTPDGHQIDSTRMPWTRTRDFSDTELKAVRAFLLSLPKAEHLAAETPASPGTNQNE
jgi:mono/diheme cytochrome c family protein